MYQYFVDNVLVVFEFRCASIFLLSCRLCQYLRSLLCNISDIKAFPRGAHLAILVPVHVLRDLILLTNLPPVSTTDCARNNIVEVSSVHVPGSNVNLKVALKR